MNQDPKKHYAIFWDYENTPLSRENYYETYLALKAFQQHHSVAYAKVFYRQSSISAEDVKIIRLLPFMKHEIVVGTEKNAVDNVLIQSCRNLLQKRIEITHLILISGDGDFETLLTQSRKQDKKMWVICQAKTKNRAFVQQANRCFYLQDLTAAPQSWWKLYRDVRLSPFQLGFHYRKRYHTSPRERFERRNPKYENRDSLPKKNLFKCPVCKKAFSKMQSMQQHCKATNHKLKLFQCEVCEKPFPNSKALIQHANAKNHKQFKCNQCDKRFASRDAVQLHIRVTHYQKQKLHNRQLQDNSPFVCEVCHKQFVTSRALLQHKTAVHHQIEAITPETFTCPQCQKQYKTHQSLNQHIVATDHRTKHFIRPRTPQSLA